MQSFDIKGAAHDADLRAARWASILSRHPDLVTVYKLLTRHPWAAPEAARHLRGLIAAKPELERSVDAPLFKEAS